MVVDEDMVEDNETRISRIRDLVESRIFTSLKKDINNESINEIENLFYIGLKFHPQSYESCCQLALYQFLIMVIQL